MIALSATEGDIDAILRKTERSQKINNRVDCFCCSIIHIKADEFAGARSSKDGDGISLPQVIKEHMIRQNAGDAISILSASSARLDRRSLYNLHHDSHGRR